MLPAARAAAAITVLDRILAGEPAERALTDWGRKSRYAGSGDRAAVRDIVYDALRCKRSFAALGGGMSGRGLVLGGLREAGSDPESLFDGSAHGPAPVGAADDGRAPEGIEALDLQDWLEAPLRQALGSDMEAVVRALRQRAPVILRVNAARLSRAAAINRLAAEGITAVPHPLAELALEVTEGARRIRNSESYLEGLVELQDASSQAVVEALPLRDGMKVLDLCAGGGGKTLAMGARAALNLFAHDAVPGRMVDLPERARRAGIKVTLNKNPEKAAPWDLVLTDVPCSGSGSWRRDPEGKWTLAAERLAELVEIQASILTRAAPMLAPGGVLAYATCSFLREENEAQIDAFLAAHPEYELQLQRRFSPLEGGDGFFLAILIRR